MPSNAADTGETPVVQPGQVWLRKRALRPPWFGAVRAVDNGKVQYEVLQVPASLRRKPLGTCNVRSFIQQAELIQEQLDYSHLDGAKQFDTFLVLSTQGEPLLRCSRKRADFYLKKGFARPVNDGVLQFTDATTEKTLGALYLGEFSKFFLAVKNDLCVCCGRANRLSRHHVVPKRHKRTVPLPWRNCLSNVLFVCLECHRRYEQTPEPDLKIADWRELRLRLEGPLHPRDAAAIPACGVGHRIGHESASRGTRAYGNGAMSRHFSAQISSPIRTFSRGDSAEPSLPVQERPWRSEAA